MYVKKILRWTTIFHINFAARALVESLSVAPEVSGVAYSQCNRFWCRRITICGTGKANFPLWCQRAAANNQNTLLLWTHMYFQHNDHGVIMYTINTDHHFTILNPYQMVPKLFYQFLLTAEPHSNVILALSVGNTYTTRNGKLQQVHHKLVVSIKA